MSAALDVKATAERAAHSALSAMTFPLRRREEAGREIDELEKVFEGLSKKIAELQKQKPRRIADAGELTGFRRPGCRIDVARPRARLAGSLVTPSGRDHVASVRQSEARPVLGTPSTYATRFCGIAGTRAPGVSTPTRFSGSQALT